MPSASQILAARCQMTPEALQLDMQQEAIATATEFLGAVKKGLITPNVYLNRCKSKAELLRTAQQELKAAQESPPKPDIWLLCVDAKYARVPVAMCLLEGLSKRQSGECRSMWQQAVDLLTDVGFTVQGDQILPPTE